MIRFRKDTPRYWFMSNYYSCEFVMNGIRYKNAEAAFQSHKVPLEERKQFSDMPPATAKHFGRHVAFPANWDETRDDVMRRVVMAKFEQNKDLKQRLLETGTQPIEEDMSSSRALTLRKLFVVEHTKPMGNAYRDTIERALAARLKQPNDAPTSYEDYEVTYHREMLPDEVKVTEYNYNSQSV